MINADKRSKIAHGLGLLVLGGIGLLPIVGWIGGEFWFLDLLNHFQAQYFVFLLLGTLLFALRRQVRSAAVSAAFLATPTLRLAPLWIGPRPDEPAAIRAASFNVYGGNEGYTRTLEWIATESPDFIYLAETSPAWKSGLIPLDADYPHQIHRFRADWMGFAFFSKHPMRETRITTHGRLAIPLLDTLVETPVGTVRVFGAHPVPPMSRFWEKEHAIYMQALTRAASGSTLPTLVLGDLNATPWSARLFPLLSAGYDNAARGSGFSATWKRTHPIFALPIDHILSRGMDRAVHFEVGPELGSDHRPILADFPALR